MPPPVAVEIATETGTGRGEEFVGSQSYSVAIYVNGLDCDVTRLCVCVPSTSLSLSWALDRCELLSTTECDSSRFPATLCVCVCVCLLSHGQH